jgi:hypothetical protein
MLKFYKCRWFYYICWNCWNKHCHGPPCGKNSLTSVFVAFALANSGSAGFNFHAFLSFLCLAFASLSFVFHAFNLYEKNLEKNSQPRISKIHPPLQMRQNLAFLVYFSIILWSAFCASVVIASISSKIISFTPLEKVVSRLQILWFGFVQLLFLLHHLHLIIMPWMNILCHTSFLQLRWLCLFYLFQLGCTVGDVGDFYCRWV